MSEQHNTSTPEGALRAKIASAAAELATAPEPTRGDSDDAALRERMARHLGVTVRKPKAQQADGDASEPAEKPKGPSVADIQKMRRQAESRLAELQERYRDQSRQRKALAAAQARADAAERLRNEDPAAFVVKHAGKSLREVITAAYEHDKLPAEAKAAKTEAAELRKVLREKEHAETAAQLRAAETKGLDTLGGIFEGVVKEADLTEAETARVVRRAYKWSLEQYQRTGKPPSLEALDRHAAGFPEFKDYVASKRKPSAAAKPAAKPAPKAKPSGPRTLEDKIRAAAKGLALK